MRGIRLSIRLEPQTKQRDRRRSGRPRTFPAEVVAGAKAMACEAPAARDVPLSRWGSSELAVQAATEGLVESTA